MAVRSQERLDFVSVSASGTGTGTSSLSAEKEAFVPHLLYSEQTFPLCAGLSV